MTTVLRLQTLIAALEARLSRADGPQGSPAEWAAVERAVAAFARVHPDAVCNGVIAALRTRDWRVAGPALVRFGCAHPVLRGELADLLLAAGGVR